jgi:hypothetical protein
MSKGKMRGKKPDDLLKEMRALDHVHGPAAYRVLVDLMRQDDDPPVKLKAAQIILEHARGKPKQTIDVAGGMDISLMGTIDTAIDNALRKGR